MKASDVRWALAVGMVNVGGYDAEHYAAAIRSCSSQLLPVAYCEFDKLADTKSIKRFVKEVAGWGYVGIKIHPRFSQISLRHKHLVPVIQEAADYGLFACLCSYLADPVWGPENTLANLAALMGRVRDEKLILFHGCTVRVLELMEIAKGFKNKLVDLSYTLCKYEGSSLDLDLKWLFKNCDRRVCIGSDHPEYSLSRMRARFEELATGLDRVQAENIAFRNLATFCGMTEIN